MGRVRRGAGGAIERRLAVARAFRTMRDSACIIMAAGLGKRMSVPIPKVLLTVAGRPLVSYVVEASLAAGVRQVVVVVGHGRERVQEALAKYDVTFAVQEQQLGTGHAVLKALPHLRPGVGLVLTMSGDSPLVRAGTIAGLIARHKRRVNAATVLTAKIPEPSGYGRVVRGASGELLSIVEERDCTDSQRLIDEINSSIYCFQLGPLAGALRLVGKDNVQGEYYLTDVIGILRERGLRVGTFEAPDWREVLGANSPEELLQLESVMKLWGRETAT
jgi:bifunctional UDP-N-acetylglucosamine pyrophosphorylase/glucosamine-1-phosphate N-acetyltransferase